MNGLILFAILCMLSTFWTNNAQSSETESLHPIEKLLPIDENVITDFLEDFYTINEDDLKKPEIISGFAKLNSFVFVLLEISRPGPFYGTIREYEYSYAEITNTVRKDSRHIFSLFFDLQFRMLLDFEDKYEIDLEKHPEYEEITKKYEENIKLGTFIRQTILNYRKIDEAQREPIGCFLIDEVINLSLWESLKTTDEDKFNILKFSKNLKKVIRSRPWLKYEKESVS